MNRIQKTFNKGPAFISYLTAGDGGMNYSLKAMLALIEGGVDILEIGVPFSDPVADGPVIQKAIDRALQQQTDIFDVLNLVKKIRKHSEVPIVLFSYYNPILAAQSKNVFQLAKDSGVDAILIVDLPLEEASEYCILCEAAKLDPIFVVTPSTPVTRIKAIDDYASGFLYYACRKGTTGVRSDLPEGIEEKLSEIKAISNIPVVAGFGISNKPAAAEVLKYADGFVVGSRFVKAVEEGASANELKQLAIDLDPRS